MALVSIGINHKTADLDVRGQLALDANASAHELSDLMRVPSVREALLLSTCNRTEIYAEADHHHELQAWLQAKGNLNREQAQNCLYYHEQEAAVRHVLRVASGLDSMVIGEPQIFGQLKQAYALAKQVGGLGGHLNRLFQYTFAVTKRIRHSSKMGSSAISVAFVACKLAKHIFSDLSQARVMIIGAGETAALIARYFYDAEVKNIKVASRSRNKAEKLAASVNGEALLLPDISANLAEADIVVSATSSALPILGKGSVESALVARKHRPMLLLDLANPRDIEVEVGQLDDAYLYDLDDLGEIIRGGFAKRKNQAEQAEAMIEAHVKYYLRELQTLDAQQMIKQSEHRVAEISDQLIKRAMRQIGRGEATEQVLAQLSKSLSNQVLHHQYVNMREAALQGDVELLAAAKQLLGLT